MDITMNIAWILQPGDSEVACKSWLMMLFLVMNNQTETNTAGFAFAGSLLVHGPKKMRLIGGNLHHSLSLQL